MKLLKLVFVLALFSCSSQIESEKELIEIEVLVNPKDSNDNN